MSRPLLTVEGLSVVRGGTLALEDVSFAARPGDLVAVVGPNGAGKSTLFAALLGLVPLAAGSFRVEGRFAYVPQHGPGDRAFPVTARDVVLMGLYRRVGPLRRLRAAERDAGERALARVGLAARASVPFGDLSGGERQRALIARALAEQGSVLLLDEPLSGVDAVSEEAILRVLAEERAEGRAVLIATHDLALARGRCSQALLLDRRAYAFGPPGEALVEETLRAVYGARLVLLGETGPLGALDEGSHHDHEH